MMKTGYGTFTTYSSHEKTLYFPGHAAFKYEGLSMLISRFISIPNIDI